MKWFDSAEMARRWRHLELRERLRSSLTRDVPLKLISLAVGFGLWAFVNASERDTELALQVPLELRGVPAALMVTSPRVDFIDLRVSGPRTLLSRIDRNKLSLALDLGGVRPGPAVFRISVEPLNLPRGVRVLRITPAQVTLDLERVVRVSLPVRLRFNGTLPAGLQVLETRVSPDNVEVIGPAPAVEELKAVETEPLDLSDAAPGALEREVDLPQVSEYISFSAQRVAAQVQIAEIEIEREFSQVPVTVRNAEYSATVNPTTIRLVVRGPKRAVELLELEAGEVYIDAAGAAPGLYKRAPAVNLPAGVEVVLQQPPVVELSLAKGRRR